MESLTIHGIARVSSAKNRFASILWLLLCLSAASMLCWTLTKSLIMYTSFNSTIKILYNESFSLALPAITICHTDYFRELNLSDPPVFQEFSKGQQHFPNAVNKRFFEVASRMFINAPGYRTSSLNEKTSQAFTFPESFSLTPFMYPCFTLNRNSSMVQLATRESYGLHMLLYYADTSNISQKEYDIFLDKRRGINIWMHEPSQELPFGTGTMLSPGFHTHISMNINIKIRLKEPYRSKCLDRGSEKTSIYPGKNSMSMCQHSCSLKSLYDKCSGVLPSMTVFMKAPKFPLIGSESNRTFWNCIFNNYNANDPSKCDCKPPCYEETYEIVTNRNPWPGKRSVQYLSKLVNKFEGIKNRNLSLNELRERLVMVSVYYEDFNEKIYEEVPLYDVISTLSNLGGQMGLFLGASLISVAELLSLSVTFLKRKFKRRNSVSGTLKDEMSNK